MHKRPANDAPDLPATVRFGDGLGQWKDELEGDHITEVVVGGAKSYAYMTDKGKIDIKQKGITMDAQNCKKITFDTFKEAVLEGKEIQSEKRFMFKTKNREISTEHLDRKIRSTLDSKRMPIGSDDSVPFGFLA